LKRKEFVKVIGLCAFGGIATGFKLTELDGTIYGDCATSSDLLGPFFRKNAPLRNDLTYPGNTTEIPIKVIGKVYGADCKTPLPNIAIDIWHCDHEKNYDMKSDEYRCRGKIFTDDQGEYWFETFVPPHYGSRPKHIHYLVDNNQGYQSLATQLYFKGDSKIKNNNWLGYPRDDRRILEIYENGKGLSEVNLDLYLTPST